MSPSSTLVRISPFQGEEVGSSPAGDTRLCPRCEKTKAVSEFGLRSNRKNQYQSYCRPCNKEYNQQHYKNNQRAYYHNQKKRKGDLRQKLYDFFKSHPCVDCGETRAAALQLDHLDRDTKCANVSTMVQDKLGWGRIETEIDKCVVRCASCHACKTAQDFKWYEDLE